MYKGDICFIDIAIENYIEGIGIAFSLKSINEWYKKLIDEFQKLELIRSEGYPDISEIKITKQEIYGIYNEAILKLTETEFKIYEHRINYYNNNAILTETERVLELIKMNIIYLKNCGNKNIILNDLNEYHFKIEEIFSNTYK